MFLIRKQSVILTIVSFFGCNEYKYDRDVQKETIMVGTGFTFYSCCT
jgi:hypothetical protein